MKLKREEKKSYNIPLTVILIQDPNDKGYTAYFEQLPDMIAEGDNEKEAIDNLFYVLYAVFKDQEKQQQKEEEKHKETKYYMNKKQMNFILDQEPV